MVPASAQHMATSHCSTPVAVAPSWSASVPSTSSSTRGTAPEVDLAR